MINDPRLMSENNQIESWPLPELFADFLARSVTYSPGFDCVDSEDKIAMVATQSANLVRILEQRAAFLMVNLDTQMDERYRLGYEAALMELFNHGK